LKRTSNIKIKLIRLFFSVIIIVCIINLGYSQPEFIKNIGQFEENILFSLKHNAGQFYFENNKVTYHLYEKDKLYKLKHLQTNNPIVKSHVYSSQFIGANLTSEVFGENKLNNYHNYFFGSDSSKWKSNVPLFNRLKYENIYEGIDLIYYENFGHLKYDLVVHPRHNPNKIKIKYKGIDKIFIQSGHLVLATSLGNVIEEKPIAYQMINNLKNEVNCKFQVKNNIVSFEFPNGYNKKYDLIIDPDIIFSTYSGSTADNWGHTATYDNEGNLYAGSVSFGTGEYPTSLGAFQTNFGGGETDICISKFSSDGSSLIYSTYFGGNSNENPHSLVVNNNNELYVLGTTGSSNFPVTVNAYDNIFNGGTYWNFGSSITYSSGTDIIVTKFSSDGNNLIGSTYVGGTGNDGINESGSGSYNNFGLCYFYADEYRGEIIIDNQNNCYVASTSKSTDFPTINADQNSNNGFQDAVVFSLNEDLSELRWSSYFGGSQNDAAYSIQLNSLNEIYITGGTLSNDLNTTTNVIHPNYNGGVDGFISKYNSSFDNLATSYIGNSGYNQCYFVQIDIEDNVFILGLTDTDLEIIPNNNYYITGSQFIQKINSQLDSLIISSSFGSGQVEKTITPTAFLVSDCGLIYVCGWGGLNNLNGSTENLPITDDAYQNSTDAADFYLGVFEENMQSLIYGTYFGGNQSNEHVDGGTSRFDKNGKVYQAVCAACGQNNDFPTTSGVVSLNNESYNCNLGVFKFAFENITTSISVPNYYACLPNNYDFDSQSEGGNLFLWDFGDGNYSNAESPSHNYSDTGTYIISLVVSDSISCVSSDTSFIQIDVFRTNDAQIIGNDIICDNQSVELTAYGGNEFIWYPSTGLSENDSQNVTASPTNTTNYMVIAIDSCGADTTFFNLQVFDDQYQLLDDTTLCLGDSIYLNAFGGTNYIWSGDNILFENSANPIVFPTQSTYFPVEITSHNGCIFLDSVKVNIDSILPVISLEDTINICLGDSILLNTGNFDNTNWTPNTFLTDNQSPSTFSSTTYDISYYVTSSNSCGINYDSIFIKVFGLSSLVFGDTSICEGDSAFINATGGLYYNWFPETNISNPDSCCTYVIPNESTNYSVVIENNFGCVDTFDTKINIYKNPLVSAGEDQWIYYGEMIELSGNVSTEIFYWESSEWLSCNDCLSPKIDPIKNSKFILHAIDSNGCTKTDTVFINLKGDLFVPNTFTPNNDGSNDYFEVKGELIEEYEIWIYNRWGQVVFHTNKISESWDGNFKNNPAELGGYIWEIEYSDYSPEKKKIKGHLNLLR